MHGKVFYWGSRRKDEGGNSEWHARKRIELNRLEYDKLRKEEDFETRWKVRTLGVLPTDQKIQPSEMLYDYKAVGKRARREEYDRRMRILEPMKRAAVANGQPRSL